MKPVVWWGVYNGKGGLVTVRRLARDARSAAAKHWIGGWPTCLKQGWELKRVFIEPATTTQLAPWPKAASADLFAPPATADRGR